MCQEPAGLVNSKRSPLIIKVPKPACGNSPTAFELAETTGRLHWKKGARLRYSFREKSDLVDYPVQRFVSFLSFGSPGATWCNHFVSTLAS